MNIAYWYIRLVCLFVLKVPWAWRTENYLLTYLLTYLYIITRHVQIFIGSIHWPTKPFSSGQTTWAMYWTTLGCSRRRRSRTWWPFSRPRPPRSTQRSRRRSLRGSLPPSLTCATYTSPDLTWPHAGHVITWPRLTSHGSRDPMTSCDLTWAMWSHDLAWPHVGHVITRPHVTSRGSCDHMTAPDLTWVIWSHDLMWPRLTSLWSCDQTTSCGSRDLTWPHTGHVITWPRLTTRGSRDYVRDA